MTSLPRIIVAGTHSGAGKTSVTLALLSALTKAGRKTQAFKVGPDYIDPSYHTAITQRPSRSLDTWMLGPEVVKTVFSNGMRGADVGVIEGVMGLFDGLGTSETSSTAEMAKLLRAPVLLVIDGHGMSRSAAAMALGYRRFDPKVRIAGIILSRVSGERHARLLSDAIESCAQIPVLGYLPNDPAIQIPERHLGLMTAQEHGPLEELREKLGAHAARYFQMDKILQLARQAPPLRWPRPKSASGDAKTRCRIGIARDAAFSFYYPDNLDLLEDLGAELVAFSPLRDRSLPDVSGLYFGGGFPEVHAEELEDNAPLRRVLQGRIADGMPVYAECGGLMYLSESIVDGNGKERGMVGAVPGKTAMTDRLQNFGYAEATVRRKTILAEQGDTIRGHEFHYSRSAAEQPASSAAYEIKKLRTGDARLEGFASKNVLATYLHINFLSRPSWARRFVESAARFKNNPALVSLMLGAAVLFLPARAHAMHISEGILPAPWAALWFLVAAPFLVWGLRDLEARSAREPHFKALVGLVGAAVFVISCMPIPVPTAGSCSHPCGTGLAAIVIGPALTVVVTSVALLLQALFLSHGGLTTLGADIVSMGVAGAFAGYGVFRVLRRLGVPWMACAFMAGLISDWATYATTAFELASALHGAGSLGNMFMMVLLAFVPTQVPLGILEGFLTAGAYRFLRMRRPELLDIRPQESAA